MKIRIRGAARAKRLLRQWRTRGKFPAVILNYHRIADEPLDPYGIAVPPARFEEQLRVIRTLARPMALRELLRARAQNKLPRRAVALTFDDGYADNLWQAAPLLEQYQIPATFFVLTGDGGRARPFWWDELARLILQTPQLPREIVLDGGSTARAWYIEKDPPPTGHWKTGDPCPSAREETFLDLWQYLRTLRADRQESVLHELRTQLSVLPAFPHVWRAMSPDEVCMLSHESLFEIGAHTITHPLLASRTPSEQQAEIDSSKRTLREWLGADVTTFAYPYGEAECFDETAVDLVRAAGYEYAVTVDDAPYNGGDPLRISRFMVHADWDWTAEQFAAWLEQWFAPQK